MLRCELPSGGCGIGGTPDHTHKNKLEHTRAPPVWNRAGYAGCTVSHTTLARERDTEKQKDRLPS
jgi:hypothetical protein